MRYKLGVKIALGFAVTVSAWAGRGADLDGARSQSLPPANRADVNPAAVEPAAFDLDLATVYRRRKSAAPAPIWESRALADDERNLAMAKVFAEVTPADRAPIFAPQNAGPTRDR